MTLLELDGVSAGYGTGRVLHGIGLTVAPGGVTALLGANGAGKTTTLRAVSGMVRRQGTLRFQGRELPASPSKVGRLGIAHVPEGRGTLRGLTVEENLMVGALLRGDRRLVAEDLERCRSLFPFLGERRRERAENLSGGEQQMLAIGRGLMSRPRLLLLDEPSLGLAPRVTEDLFAMLPTLRAEWEVAMLIVEQNANLALRIADTAVVLEAGRVALQGPAREIAGRDDVRRAYLGDLGADRDVAAGRRRARLRLDLRRPRGCARAGVQVHRGGELRAGADGGAVRLHRLVARCRGRPRPRRDRGDRRDVAGDRCRH